MKKKERLIYGPVLSRRLGRSLGINLTPHKTCSFDCCYCQCGRTTVRTVHRDSYVEIEDLLEQVREAVAKFEVDYLTISGSGEPTLNRDIGKIIRRLKEEFRIPVAVITNATLLSNLEVRRALYAADLVVPTLSAADEKVFRRLHRPCPGVRLAAVIYGLKVFRRYFSGKIYLEIMLVKDVNDAPEHLMKLRRIVWEIKPDLVHLNTVVRPPADKSARPLSDDELNQIRMLFGGDAQIATVSVDLPVSRFRPATAQAVLQVIRNRPVTAEELSSALNLSLSTLHQVLAELERVGAVKRVKFRGAVFYEPTSQPV